MADILDNVKVADTFTDAATCGPIWASSGGYFSVGAGADVYVQLGSKQQGVADIVWTAEAHVSANSNGVLYADTVAVRFRNYVAGGNAIVSAGIYSKQEPTLTLTAGGATGTSGGSAGVTGDIVWSGAASRAGAVPCDGSFYDGTTDTYKALYNAIGNRFGGTSASSFAVPNLHDRVPVGAGGNTAGGANEGVADANRHATRHRHSVNDPGHAHSYGSAAGQVNTTGNPYPGGNFSGATSTQTTGISIGVSSSDPLDVTPYLGLFAYILL